MIILRELLPLSSQDAGGALTDFTSFYTLPSTVMHHPLHRSLKAAYSFYNIHTQTPLLDLVNDALILAKLVSVLSIWSYDVNEWKPMIKAFHSTVASAC